MNVICYGDSNTYGYDPRSFFGGRYAADSRWVDILRKKTGWRIKNDGMNGREIPHSPLVISPDTDLLIVMLGSNDLLQGNKASRVAARMEGFLTALDFPRDKILLIPPPPMQPGEWVTGRSLIHACAELSEAYRRLALQLGIRYVNSGDWSIPMTYDGVHFTPEGHRVFAAGLYRELCPE